MYPITKEHAKELFKVKTLSRASSTRNGIRDPDIKAESYMTQESIDYTKRYNHYWTEILDVNPIGKVWPNNAIVKLDSVGDRGFRCYSEASYTVESDSELTDDDFNILRANGCFMSGQETGTVGKHWTENGKHFYSCRSVCDSSD